MTFLYLLLLLTQSLALEFTLPSSFGGKTNFSDRGWRNLISQLSPDVTTGRPPEIELSLGQEPTCVQQYSKCSTSYFGKEVALTRPKSAQLWVKWHEDATPFACHKPDGCTITSASSVADLSSQSRGWGIAALIKVIRDTGHHSPTILAKERAVLGYRYSDAHIAPRTMTSKKTITSRCFHNHMCYLQTGTLMMNISGKCDSKPLIVCDRHYYPCEEFNHARSKTCTQWATFVQKHCRVGRSMPNIENCSLSVAVTRENDTPVTYQVFEQKPISGMRVLAKREYIEPGNPFGELPDGSSGAWMEWSR